MSLQSQSQLIFDLDLHTSFNFFISTFQNNKARGHRRSIYSAVGSLLRESSFEESRFALSNETSVFLHGDLADDPLVALVHAPEDPDELYLDWSRGDRELSPLALLDFHEVADEEFEF